MFSIRNAAADDIPLIRELIFQIWPQTYAAILSPQQIDYMLEMMYSEVSLKKQMNDGAKFIVAYENENPVGFASFQETQPTIYKLHKIYILATQQGKGTGRFVIDHILNEIKQEGATLLELQVNKNNKAKSFYEKLGFTAVKEIKLDIGNGYFMDDYIMEKKI